MSRGGYGSVTQRNPNQVPNIAAAGVENIAQGHRIAYPYAKFPNGTGIMDVSLFPRQIPFAAPTAQCFYGIPNSMMANGGAFPHYVPARFPAHTPFEQNMFTVQPILPPRPIEKRKRQPLPIINPNTNEAVQLTGPQKKESGISSSSSSTPLFVPAYDARVPLPESRISHPEQILTQNFTAQRPYMPTTFNANTDNTIDTHDLQYAVMSSLSTAGSMTSSPHTGPITTDVTSRTVLIKQQQAASDRAPPSKEELTFRHVDEQRKPDSTAAVTTATAAAAAPPTAFESVDEKDRGGALLEKATDKETEGGRIETTREFTSSVKPSDVKEHGITRGVKEEGKSFDASQGWLPSSMIKSSDTRIDMLDSDEELDAFSTAQANGESLSFYSSSANGNEIANAAVTGAENGESEAVAEAAEETRAENQAKSNERNVEYEVTQRYTYTRDFLLECYKNPLTRVKPPNLPNISEILQKPHENLVETFRRTPAGEFFRSGMQTRRKENIPYRTNYSRPMLHQSDNPYTVKTAQQISDLEASARKFRSLMNKITESNFDNIMDHMGEIDTSQDGINDILEIIFDKAVQEPKFTPIYARVCQKLSKMSSEMATSNSFKTKLVTKVQTMFKEKITNTEAYHEKLQKIKECQNPAEKKKLEEELEETLRSRKRKGMGNVKFIGELFRAGLLTESIIDTCIRDLFSDQVIEWQYESLCVLLTNIGSSFSEEKINNIFAKLHNVLPQIEDKRIRFMFLDLFDLREANWVSRRDELGRLKDLSKLDHRDATSARPSGFGIKHIPSPRSSELKYASQSSEKGYRHSIQLTSPENLYLGRQDNISLRNQGRRGTVYENERLRKTDLSYAKITARRSDSLQDARKHDDIINPKPYKGSISSSSDRIDDSNTEEFNDAVRNILGSDKSMSNAKETTARLKELGRDNDTTWSNLINSALQYIFDQRDDKRLELSQFLMTMLNKEISEKRFVNGMSVFLSNADELSTDVPLLYKYLGEFLSYLFIQKNVKRLKILKKLLSPILKTPKCSEVLGSMLETAARKFSNETVKEAWEESELDLGYFVKEEELDDFCRRYKQQFMQNEMFLPKLYEELKNFFSKDSCTNEEIIAHIEANYKSEDINNSKIMRPIITALAEVSVIPDDHNGLTVNENKIKARKCLIITLTKQLPAFELEALKTVSNYVLKIGSPFGVLQRFFYAFYGNEIICEETFHEWRNVEEQRDVHCNAFLSANGFFEWLQQADTEE